MEHDFSDVDCNSTYLKSGTRWGDVPVFDAVHLSSWLPVTELLTARNTRSAAKLDVRTQKLDQFCKLNLSMWAKTGFNKMADNSIKLKTSRTAGAIGSLAARKREQLEQFNAEHRRLEEKRRKAREQLTNELNKIQTRERRRQRNQEQSDDKRIRFILGGLMLTALRSQGQEAFGVGPADLSRLKLTEFALLSEILARPVTEVRPKAKPRAGGGASGEAAVDVAL